MKVLVTGGAGFIGSNFVKMHGDGRLDGIDELIVLDVLTYAGNLGNFSDVQRSKFTFVQGDILDSSLLNTLLPGVDAIVHFAAESHVDRSISGSSQFVVTNVLGTHSLLEAARFNQVKTFVHISTDEVYGSIDKGSWDESEPLQPNSPYAASKASSDLIVRSYYKTYGMDVRITRSSNNFGRNQFPEKVIPLFVTNLLENKKIPLYGDGSNVRDWLYVDDHCRGINLVLFGGTAGDIYNIGGGLELSNSELTKTILTKMDKGMEMVERVPDRLGHDRRYSVNYQKIAMELGYKPLVNFDQAISEVLNWYKENSDWWRPLKYRSEKGVQ